MPVYEFGFTGKTLSAKVVNVYDACTFKAEFKLSSKVAVSCKCRLLDLDCPRMKPHRRTPFFLQEKAAAHKARGYFMGLLRQLGEDEGGYFPVTCHGHVHGQVLVTVPWDETGSVGDIMVGEGHARTMTPGRRPPWSFPDVDPSVRIGMDDEEAEVDAEAAESGTNDVE